MTLRLLLMKDNPLIFNLRHHTDLRQTLDPQTWTFHQKFVVEPIKKMGEFQERDIWTVLGILLTNTISIPIENGSTEVMGLFPKYAMMNHSCSHNTKTNIITDSPHAITVQLRARKRILNGEEITTRYLPPSKGKVYQDLHLGPRHLNSVE